MLGGLSETDSAREVSSEMNPPEGLSPNKIIMTIASTNESTVDKFYLGNS